MKKVIVTTFCFCLFLASAFAQTTDSKAATATQTETATLVVKTEIYCSHCDKCGSCKPRVENAVKMKKGVKSVAMNSTDKTITVVYNPTKTDPAAIRQAIAETGYDADEVKATKAGYEGLDGCCKKH